MDEQGLIQRAADGDRAAFESLVEWKRERVFWIAYHLVGDRELARDVAQEVFLRLYRVLVRFRSGAPFEPWLYRMTVHLAIDALRRERVHRAAVPIESTAEPPERDSGHRTATPGALPSDRGDASPAELSLRQREVRRIFVELSRTLSPKQRIAFVLREIEGLSTAEVAGVLKTKESTVRNHVLQGRRILQAELRRRYPEYCRPRGEHQS